MALAAQQDLVAHLDIDDQNTYNQVQNLIDGMNTFIQSQTFQDLEIGASFSENGLQGIEDTLNSIITSAGMTADEASTLLASMGVDAELEPVEAESEDTSEYTDLVPQEGAGHDFTFTMPSGNDGKDISTTESTFHIPGVQWTTTKGSSTDVKKATGTAVKYTASNGKSSGGKVQIKRGTAKKAATGGAKHSAASPRSLGGGSGGSCFIAGTKISMCGYYKNIEDIEPGDIVLSYNEELKRNEYSIVLQTMIHNRKERLYTLYVENDEITATNIHRFLIVRAGKEQWLPAEDLYLNDLMLSADGSCHRIHQIKITTRFVTTYNF